MTGQLLMERDTQLEVSILIPAHNEEKRMEPCLIRLTDFLKRSHPSSEIVISEDGSKDRTVEIVNEFKQRNSEIQITLLHATERLGKGGGLKRGIEACNGQFTVFTDTDLPVPLETISQALELLRSGADVVAGSRVMKGSKRNEPLKRRVLSLRVPLPSPCILGNALGFAMRIQSRQNKRWTGTLLSDGQPRVCLRR